MKYLLKRYFGYRDFTGFDKNANGGINETFIKAVFWL